ncbi:MAG: aldo/keto reductase [Acidimicrobiales bacterium]|nr:aldo/keto reductase [Acidimicrobiia bacterium]MBV8464192.1 aldo/keto reductase [Acidimicrobiales bacterium]
MSSARPVDASGTLQLGSLEVHRLGFGAMRLTGAGIWGAPPDPAEARKVLRRAVELGVDFVDTADSYGPYVSEELIREALHPYDGVTVATKAGLVRTGPGQWSPVGRPEYLRQECEMSLRRLGVDRIDLFQLHRIDAAVPAEDQFGVLRDLRDEGKVAEVGLSEVSVAEVEACRAVVPVASVQNLYNVGQRDAEDVLDHCEAHGIGFIPWYPLSSGDLTDEGRLEEIAVARGATHAQVALAWLLRRSPVVVPIPGTSTVAHLEENCAAAEVELSDDDVAALDAIGR